MLSIAEGVLLCISFGLFLAVSIHFWPASIRRLSYGDPTQIKARMASTCVATAIILASFAAVVQEPPEELAVTLGFRVNGLVAAVLLPLVLVHVAYFAAFLHVAHLGMKLDREQIQGDAARQAFLETFPNRFDTGLEFCRDVVVAPITEELVFRCVNIEMLITVGVQSHVAAIVSAAVFSVAHFTVGCGTRKEEALAQMVYTFVFGIITAFAFLRTRQFVFVFTLHAISNFYNVPDIPFTFLNIVLAALGFAAFGMLFFVFTNPVLYQDVPYRHGS